MGETQNLETAVAPMSGQQVGGVVVVQVPVVRKLWFPWKRRLPTGSCFQQLKSRFRVNGRADAWRRFHLKRFMSPAHLWEADGYSRRNRPLSVLLMTTGSEKNSVDVFVGCQLMVTEVKAAEQHCCLHSPWNKRRLFLPSNEFIWHWRLISDR